VCGENFASLGKSAFILENSWVAKVFCRLWLSQVVSAAKFESGSWMGSHSIWLHPAARTQLMVCHNRMA
jgi:hypothetical protein